MATALTTLVTGSAGHGCVQLRPGAHYRRPDPGLQPKHAAARCHLCGRHTVELPDAIDCVPATVAGAPPHRICTQGTKQPETVSLPDLALEDTTGNSAMVRHQPMQAGDANATFTVIEVSRR